MAKEIHYESVAARVISERDITQVVLMLIRILEAKLGPFFEDGMNEQYPRADGEPHTDRYTKPT